MARRPLTWLSAVLLVPVVGLAFWTDSAPRVGRIVLTDINSVGLRVEDRLGLDLSGAVSPVPPDLGVHIVLWGAVGFLAHRLAARRFPAVLVTAAVVVASYLFELGQALFTASRTVQADDMIANVVGVMVGALAAQVLQWTVRRRPLASGQ